MTKRILLFVLIVFASACSKKRTSTTEFIITDFSKPIEITYQAKHRETKSFDYGVEGRITGGKMDILTRFNSNHEGWIVTFKDDVKFDGDRPSGFGKREMRIITLLPDSGVVGKVKIFFKEKSILINNEEHSLF